MAAFWLLLVILFGMGAPESTASETPSEKYLCVAEHAAGFHYDGRNWTSQRFKTDGKYLITPSTTGSGLVVTKMGHDSPRGTCKNGFSEKGGLHCDMVIGEMFFNKNNGGFILTDPYAYLDTSPEEQFKTDASPYMEIGKCSKF